MQVKGIGSLVALIVCVVLFASVLLPVMSSATEDLKVNNTVGYSATIADADDEVDTVFEWSSNTLTVDGITYNYSVNDIAIISDVAILTTTTVSPYCTFVQNGTNIALPNSITVSIHNGQIHASWVASDSTTGEVTLDYSWVAYRNNAGSDRIFNAVTNAKTVYYSEDYPIYGIRMINGQPLTIVGDKAAYLGSEYEPTINGTEYKGDIYQASVYFQNPSDVSVVIENTTYYPLYGAVSGQVVSSQDSTLLTMLGIIPILVIVGIVLATVQFIRMRD